MKCMNCDDRGEVRTPDGEWIACPVCASPAEEAEPGETQTLPVETVPTVENESTPPQETVPEVPPLPDETKPQ